MWHNCTFTCREHLCYHFMTYTDMVGQQSMSNYHSKIAPLSPDQLIVLPMTFSTVTANSVIITMKAHECVRQPVLHSPGQTEVCWWWLTDSYWAGANKNFDSLDLRALTLHCVGPQHHQNTPWLVSHGEPRTGQTPLTSHSVCICDPDAGTNLTYMSALTHEETYANGRLFELIGRVHLSAVVTPHEE